MSVEKSALFKRLDINGVSLAHNQIHDNVFIVIDHLSALLNCILKIWIWKSTSVNELKVPNSIRWFESHRDRSRRSDRFSLQCRIKVFIERIHFSVIDIHGLKSNFPSHRVKKSGVDSVVKRGWIEQTVPPQSFNRSPSRPLNEYLICGKVTPVVFEGRECFLLSSFFVHTNGCCVNGAYRNSSYDIVLNLFCR